MKTFSLALVLTCLSTSVSAITVATVPVGYMKFALAGKASTSFGIPLDDTSVPSAGIRAGVIGAFTATTLTHSGGGWTGNLANPAAPWLVRLTSGASAGKLLDITANTPTTLTISGADLTTLGLVAGTDTFELLPMDTLFSLFGTDTLAGGASSGVADIVQIRGTTAWVSYFFDPGLGYWRTTSTAATPSNNVPIRPGSGVIVQRRGTAALTLTFTGRVPAGKFRMAVNNSSTTVLHSGFPVDATLGSFAAQTLLPGWKTGTSSNTADTLAIYTGATSAGYIHNGTSWIQVGSTVSKDATPIPAGSLLMIQRTGTATGTTDLVRLPPYSL